MRCLCCNSNLTDFEATRKSKTTGQFLDMCEDCFKEVADVFIEIEENKELKDIEEEVENYHEL